MSSTQVIGKTANETPRTRTVEMKLEVVVIPVSDVRNGARGAMVRLALAAALVPASNFPARAQNCPPGYKMAHGACMQSCPVDKRTLAAFLCIAGKAEAADLNQRRTRAPSIIGASQ
jgi:hypothetical protein